MLRHGSIALASVLALAMPLVGFASSPRVATAEDEANAGSPVLLQLQLERGGKVLRHPGHMAVPGEVVILTFTTGEIEHEVELLVEAAKDGHRVAITYRKGEQALLEGSVHAKGKRWAKLAKKNVSVSVRIDPDAKRPDELELPDNDDPLAGAK